MPPIDACLWDIILVKQSVKTDKTNYLPMKLSISNSLFWVFISFFVFSVNAQKNSLPGLAAQVDGAAWKSEAFTCSAVWDSIKKTLSITANNGKNESITILLTSHGPTYSNGFKTGEYYFAQSTTWMDNYALDFEYSKTVDGKKTTWSDNNNAKRSYGKVVITNIDASKVTGTFYADLVKQTTYSYDTIQKVSIRAGTFEMDIGTKKSTESTISKPTTSEQANPEKRKFESPIGIFDVQVAPGVNWIKPKVGLNFDGDFGLTYDVGFTLINLAHSKNGGSSSTISFHVDYSKQNAEASLGSWHFRRKEIYARLKPFTNNPAYTSTFSSNGSWYLLGFLLSGLYVDVGYTNGTYFYTNYLDEKQAPNYAQNGMIWGWGYNAIHRPEESRWGMTAGYGSKIYNWTKANGDRAKYSSRMIWIGVTYNITWRE